jgi:2-methylcitrate dehydratase PrpD
MVDKLRAQSEQSLRKLVEWAAAVRFDDLPPSVRRKTALVVTDDLAAMLAAKEEPEILKISEQKRRRSTVREATIFLDGARTDRYTAALVNAAAGGWCQLDEGYGKVSCHAGLYVLPALLAEAEAEDLSVADLLCASAVAYEIVTRIARTWQWKACPIHVHARYSAVGAAAGVGLARRLAPHRLMDAISGAAAIGPVGPLDQMVKGALISNMYAAVGAWSGMHAVEWAEAGIGGLAGSLHDVYGAALNGICDPAHLTKDLGREWAIDFGFHKRFACCQRIHAGADAVLDLLPELPEHNSGHDIARVVVTTHDPQLSSYEPANSLATRFSFPHALAAMIVLRHGEAHAFSGATLADPDIAELRRKVEIIPYRPALPWPHDRAVRVEIAFSDGRMFARERLSARGSPDQPFSEQEVLDKAKSLCAPIYPRLVPVMFEVIAQSQKRLGQRWRSVVEDIASDTGRRKASAAV